MEESIRESLIFALCQGKLIAMAIMAGIALVLPSN